MYGLPKTHKEGTALRPILSMTCSSHHELGKWLAGLLQPVLERFSSHCISNSFTFAKNMQNLDINPNVFMCSFDVSSLFTNVPLDKTIKICSDVLCDDSDLQPFIPKNVFVELMKNATSSVEFSFNNTMYKQTDGVAMGLPLDPALANIVVGYYEEKLFMSSKSAFDMIRNNTSFIKYITLISTIPMAWIAATNSNFHEPSHAFFDFKQTVKQQIASLNSSS